MPGKQKQFNASGITKFALPANTKEISLLGKMTNPTNL